MGITGSIIVYVMIWWIIFFSVLPIGIQSNKEIYKEKIGGNDPGAPKNPRIVQKFLLTTLIIFLVVGQNDFLLDFKPLLILLKHTIDFYLMTIIFLVLSISCYNFLKKDLIFR